jgi:hypothetical protein
MYPNADEVGSMVGLWVATASADEPILHDGDPGRAVAAVAAATGEPAWAFDPVTVAQIAGSGEPWVEGAAPIACPTRWTNTALRERLSGAEDRARYAAFADVRADLESAELGFACLSEPSEASLATELYSLLAVARAELGDADGAADAFSRAMRFTPELPWDDKLNPRYRPAYDDARRALATGGEGELRLGPGPQVRLWVDGRPVEGGVVRLPAGWHLVQTLQPKIASFVVDLRSGAQVRVFVPSSLADAKLADIDVAWRPALGAWLARQGAAWAWEDGKVWRLGASWEELPVPTDPRRTASIGRALRFTGLGLGIAGLGVAGYSLIERISSEQADGAEPLASETGYRRGRYELATTEAWIGTGLAGAGALTATIGFVIGPPPKDPPPKDPPAKDHPGFAAPPAAPPR